MQSYLVLAGIVLTFLTALLGWFKGRQSVAVSKENADKIQEVHVLVNAQLTAVVARVGQLVTTLKEAGVPVPEPPDPTGQTTGEQLPRPPAAPGPGNHQSDHDPGRASA